MDSAASAHDTGLHAWASASPALEAALSFWHFAHCKKEEKEARS
jgi:hypothetical protein